ncbi:lysozyme inhibitor LprI family protein [Marinobacter sp. KM021]|uniref:hypothetical protein n=1 Tax=Marinobacter sp. KM021 TaxID=3075616 RepID=UPI003D6B6E00
MKNVLLFSATLLIGLGVLPSLSAGEPGERPFQERLEAMVSEADQLYEQGKKDAAKTGYLLASYMGSPEAHFNLAYRYIVDDREYHLEQAAIQGHEKALRLYLDHTFYRAGSIRQANPHKAAAVYARAISENSDITFKYLDPKTSLLYASELAIRDKEAFFTKYRVEDEDGKYPFYDVWELAEKASRPSEVFGQPNPELVFWLITHGGVVPSEMDTAVKVYYQRWKTGGAIEFNLCEFVTSGIGATHCATRNEEIREKERNTDIDSLMSKLDPVQASLLQMAYQEMAEFVTLKAQGEEMHGGTAFSATIAWSIDEQKQEFINLVSNIINRRTPQYSFDLHAEDAKLNEEYGILLSLIEANPDLDMGLNSTMVSLSDFRNTQRQWIKYRDAMEQFFHSATGKSTKKIRGFLTHKRNEDLISLKNYISSNLR